MEHEHADAVDAAAALANRHLPAAGGSDDRLGDDLGPAARPPAGRRHDLAGHHLLDDRLTSGRASAGGVDHQRCEQGTRRDGGSKGAHFSRLARRAKSGARPWIQRRRHSAPGARAHRAVAHRRPARRHRLHRAVQLRLRPTARRRSSCCASRTPTRRARAPTARRRSFARCAGWGSRWDEGPDVGGPHGPYRQSRAPADLPRARRPLLESRPGRTAASAPPSGWPSCASSSRPRSWPLGYDRLCRGLDPAEAARRAAAGEPHVVRLAVPTGGKIVVHDRLRGEVTFDNDADRRPGAAQVGRLPDLPPRQRGRRSPDGDHPRHPRRGVDLVDAQARAALPGVRLGAARVDPHAAPAQRRQVEDLQAQEPGLDRLLPRRRLPARGAAQLPRPSWAGRSAATARSSRSPRWSTVFSWDRVSLGGPVFDLDKLRWLNEQYLHELDDAQLADALVGWRLGPRPPVARGRRWCASASSGSTTSCRPPTSSSPAISTTRRWPPSSSSRTSPAWTSARRCRAARAATRRCRPSRAAASRRRARALCEAQRLEDQARCSWCSGSG